MLWAAYKVKREDGGPVFYSQTRIGIYGKPFTMYKFRSMRLNADKMDAEVAAAAGVELGTTFKVKDDPRVTIIGKFIRKTSIDEVPQFFNVLKGDMSMVGPLRNVNMRLTSTRHCIPLAYWSSRVSPALGRFPGVMICLRNSLNMQMCHIFRIGLSRGISRFC